MAKVRHFSRKKLGCLGVFFVLFLVGLVWYNRQQWVQAGYVGVIYNARGGVDRTKVLMPGRYFVGLFQQLYTYPTKVQTALYSEDPASGEQKAADGIQITTSDTANTVYDVTVIYRIAPKDVFTVFDKFGPIPIEDIQALHIRRAIKEIVNDIGPKYDFYHLAGEDRFKASQELTAALRDRLSPRGITIMQVLLGTDYPSNDRLAQINQRVNATTQLAIADTRRQQADIQRQIAVVSGQAESQARAITAAQTTSTSADMLALQIEARAVAKFKAGGGHLPRVQAKPGMTVIIGGNGVIGTQGAR